MTDHNFRFGPVRYFIPVYVRRDGGTYGVGCVERPATDVGECPVEVKVDEPEKTGE